jgi:elongation factor 1-gamma
MAAGTLYTYPNNFRAFKILIAARYSNEQIRVVSEPPEFVLGETNKTGSFLEKFPFGKVPAFETADGVPIYETNAIMYYVTHEELHGKTKVEAAQILQFVNVADQEILPAACTWVFPTYGIIQFNKQVQL